jgi:multimeric flavodoxin WrbA
MRIEPCRGCFVCFHKGSQACPLDDDREKIEEKMDAADAVVFATPVYSMHVTYLLKTLIDRMAYTFHRPRFFGKYAVGLAVAGSIGQEQALKYVEETSESWGFHYIGGIAHADQPAIMKIPGADKRKTLGKKDERVAERLYRHMKRNIRPRVRFKDSLNFHVMRNVYSRMERYSPADYSYWKERGWLEPGTRYFTKDARVGLLRSLYGRAIGWFVGRMIDREFSRMKS